MTAKKHTTPKPNKPAPPPNPNPDWQDRDIKLRPVVWALAILSLAAVASAIAMYALLMNYRAAADRRAADVSPMAKVRELPAAPLLQVNAAAEWADHQAKQNDLLHHYAWKDQMRGIAQIPIERAMELVAADMPTPTSAPPPAPEPEPEPDPTTEPEI